MKDSTLSKKFLTSIILVALATLVVLWFKPGPSPELTPHQSQSINAELKKIYDDDQSDSRPYDTSEQKKATDDRARLRINRVSEMISKGQLQSPEDYYHAAMIFQHGNSPQDYLTAHVLANVAGFKGHRRGSWLSAASLDLFLLSAGRSQVLGTVYGKENFQRYEIFLTDEIRSQFCVPPLDVQKRNEEFVEKGGGRFQRWTRECE